METKQMTDTELQPLWQVLNSNEQTLLKNFIDCLDGIGTIKGYNISLETLLIAKPYPLLQLLNVYYPNAQFYIGRIIKAALNQLLKENLDELTPRFINFIANFPLQVLEEQRLQDNLLQRLMRFPIQDDIYLALLAQKDTQLLMEFLRKLEQTLQTCSDANQLSTAYVLHQALNEQQHFVPQLCKQIKNFESIANVCIRNNLLILKIAQEFALATQTLDEVGCISNMLAEYATDTVEQEQRAVHNFFYADFQRLNAILEFLNNYDETLKTMKIESLLKATSVLELLYQQSIEASYADTLRLLERVYSWRKKTPELTCIQAQELETLAYYHALCLVYTLIGSDESSQFYTRNMQQLHVYLRQIRSFETLCALIEDIFQLVFLRWEHVQCNSNESLRSRSYHYMSSTDDDNYEEDAVPDMHTTISTVGSCCATRHGFICRAAALQAIFTFLKQYVTKKLHTEDYKHATQDLHTRFQHIVEVINEALWKYGVLEKIDESLQQAGVGVVPQYLQTSDILLFVKMHTDVQYKSSSDDDSRERDTAAIGLTRRKKRRRATISGPTSMGLNGERLNAQTLSSKNLKTHNQHGLRLLNERSIIPKMLGTPENLAIMALALKNFSDVKYIIETFHLENTTLNQELQFVEQQQQLKQKLCNIYANYCQQVELSEKHDTRTPLATVEQIKIVAAKGFEMSKIISVVDNFAQTQRIQQSETLKQLLQKHANHAPYAFLQQYDERNLNAIIICDLIINLPLNREVSTNLVVLIRRQQHHRQPHSSSAAQSNVGTPKTQMPKQMDAMSLLEQICECMRLMESTHQQPKLTLNEMLYANCYTLKPRQLALELQRETAFKQVYYKTPSEYAHCRDLKAQLANFQQLKSKCNYYARFCNYVTQLTRLVKMRDTNLEYHTSQLLELEPYTIIGELIYECNMTPLELETPVAAINLNLVHVIALNICPELVERTPTRSQQPNTPQKQQTILNYIKQHNQLLAYLLQAVHAPSHLTEHDNMQGVYLQRLVTLPQMETLAQLYNGNKLIAALSRPNIDMQTLTERVPNKAKQLQILLNECGNKPADKLPHKQIDELISALIMEDAKNICLVAHMHDIAMRAELLQCHFTKISTTRLAKQLIEYTLQHKHAVEHIPAALRLNLEHTLADITTYAKVSEVLRFESWPQAYDFGRKTPNAIFAQLLNLQRYKLCYEWCQIVKLGACAAAQQRQFMATLLEALLSLDDEVCAEVVDVGVGVGIVDKNVDDVVHVYLLKILEIFTHNERFQFLDAHKDKFRALSLHKYAVQFLLHNAPQPIHYRNYELSIVIFEQLTPSERCAYWHLLRLPLLIIEQLVMNAKFELLAKVLSAVRHALKQSKRDTCAYCFDKRGNIYDIHNKETPHKQRFQLGQQHAAAAGTSTSSAFILLNFNLYQQDHIISNECIDLLLRIYATKALDYHIADTTSSSSEYCSQLTDIQQSLDSLCGAFQLPEYAPRREDWVRDDDATHCMCCRRTAFTMLMRRHHCRRCGRVVCYACSMQRMRIPELYEEVEVRVCNDCHKGSVDSAQHAAGKCEQDQQTKSKQSQQQQHKYCAEDYKWCLSGNITHDKLLREEFCYEHAPSVALSLSILDYHLGQQKCVDLLLYHCRKLEKLFVPNPEVDYELVAKMMNCLALAAKVRGAPAEFEAIREHSEIIMSVVQRGCGAFIPPGPLNKHNLRKLADALVQTEHWQLALEVHLKCGFSIAGVMAAHGLACLRAGCYETAREKFTHCMPKCGSEQTNNFIYKQLFNYSTTVCDSNDNISKSDGDFTPMKRPQRGPPLLQEILKLLATMPQSKTQPETLKRASLIRSSNSSLASFFSRRKEPYVVTKPLHEPALNVLNTLANLKNVAKGQYNEGCLAEQQQTNKRRTHTRSFEESMHYLLTFGAHADIINFLMQHDEMCAALKYFQLQHLEPEHFIQHIFLSCLRSGQLPMLIEQLHQFDDAQHTLWRAPLIHTCRYLEKQKQLNSLYQLQLLLKDPIRASMTCVRFYAMNCTNFQQLHANAQHLRNAQMHLQSELELTQWETINLDDCQQRSRRNSSASNRRASNASNSSLCAGILMQMDARALNGHINTILRQLDVAKFLAQCEQQQQQSSNEDEALVTENILKQIRADNTNATLPTLFEGPQDKIQICILILLCGKNIDEGFGLAYRIIQDYKLAPMKIFGATAKYLARNQRLHEVEKLLNCITSNNGTSTRDIDELLSIAINSASNCNEPTVKTMLDNLAKKINNIELRISSHIFIGQLKSAYLLANKYERLTDIRKILRQAELTNQIHIKKLCEKKLNINNNAAASPTATATATTL